MRLLLATAAVSLILSSPVQANEKDWDNAGSISRDVLVVAAFGLPIVKGDWDGALQAGGSMGAAMVTTVALKEAFPTWRPDRSDRKSFPSGHTSLSF
ncbi:MAG: phosphatase PAP2 family protein, partial [Sphingorhabdus sp.]